jgi:hypothetical protein
VMAMSPVTTILPPILLFKSDLLIHKVNLFCLGYLFCVLTTTQVVYSQPETLSGNYDTAKVIL